MQDPGLQSPDRPPAKAASVYPVRGREPAVPRLRLTECEMELTMQKRLLPSAILFGVLWSAWMIWALGRHHLVHDAILIVCGAVTATLWYWAMKRYLAWVAARQRS
jgi:hypothetical protein